MISSEPDTKTAPSIINEEKTGIICVRGPKNNQRVPWDGNKEAVMEFVDKNIPWLKHRYLYTKVSGVESGVVINFEFMGYEGTC
jgi:hypothetical protein